MRLAMSLVALLCVLPLVVEPAVAEETHAMCPVCQVTQGEREPEEIKARRSHQGQEFGFCSKDCAEAFDADPVAYLPPVLPRPAPAFAFRTLSGDSISSHGLRGKVTLVDFWATWCVPCRKSMPELQKLHDEYAARGLVVLGVSIDEPKHAKKVREFIEDKRITYPIAIDSERAPAWDRYRVKAIPAAYLLDAEGRIVAQWTGLPADPAEVTAKLEELLRVD